MSVLDCRGMPCPQPVVCCRDWLKEGKHAGEMLEVLGFRQKKLIATPCVSC